MSASQVMTASSKVSVPPTLGRVSSIGIAGLDVVKHPDKIRTVLGSCIGIAIYDRVAKVGGLAHIILPASSEGTGNPAKFGDTAVDLLIDKVLGEGAQRARLAAKIAGGAAMFGGKTAGTLGVRNTESVKQRLAEQKVRLVAEAIGGARGRKMMLDPSDGSVQVEIIGESPEII